MPERALPVLEEHGTRLMVLRPSSIWAAAMEDLKRRAYNKDPGEEGFKVYAFHRKHVLKADTANDVIRAAIAEPGIGMASGKRDTRLLYSDIELLKAALH